jgi:hypothetical protein
VVALTPAQAARILYDTADLMERAADCPATIAAYRDAAWTILSTPPDQFPTDAAGHLACPGIGSRLRAALGRILCPDRQP